MCTMLVGREHEWQLVSDRLDRDLPILVFGEPGIGKTTLLREAAAATGRGVLEGGALASLGWMPFLPLARALGERRLGGDAAAVARRVRERLMGRVLVIDDVHWADEGTIEAIELLAPSVPIAAAARPGGPAWTTLQDRLLGAGFVVVELPPLADAEAEAVVRAARADLSVTAIRRLVRRCGGNPLLLGELAGHDGEAAESLRLVVGERVSALSESARSCFSLLSLAGRPIPRQALATRDVGALRSARLVQLRGDDVEVRHALIGEIAVARLDAPSTMLLHRRLADIVETPGEVARHLEAAGEPVAAAEAALRAASTAVDHPAERAAHLGVAARCTTGAEADALRLSAASALASALDHASAEAILDEQVSDDLAVRTEAAIVRSRTRWGLADPEGARTAIHAGVVDARRADPATAARMAVETSREWMFIDWQPLRAVETAEGAMEAAEAAGIAPARARMLLGLAYYVADDPRWLMMTERALQEARSADDLETELPAANNLITGHESAGDPRLGRRVAAQMIERTARLGLETWRSQFRAMAINLDLHAGDLIAVVEQCAELLDEPLDPATRRQVENSLHVALIDLGRFEVVAERLASTGVPVDATPRSQSGTARWIAAEAALWGGRPGDALRLAGEAREAGFEDVFAPLVERWAAFELGAAIPGPLPPTEHPLERAARPESVGILALATDHPSAAVLPFDEAAGYWRPYHKRGELRCRWAAAEALRRSGSSDDARARLLDLERELKERAMLPLLSRVHRSLRLLGVRRAAPRAHNDVHGLTAREREVPTSWPGA